MAGGTAPWDGGVRASRGETFLMADWTIPQEQSGTPSPEHLPKGPSVRALALGAVVSIVALLGMVLLDQSLRTPAAPNGIVSLELAGSLAAAQRILDTWPAAARIQAGISLGLDFSFLAAYAFTLAGACRKVAFYLSPEGRWCRPMGGILAKAAWVAGCLDGVENLALIQFLISPYLAWPPVLAACCAWPKFGLAAIILFYIGLGGAMIATRRWRARTSA